MKNRKTLLQNVVIFLPFVHLLIINIYQITQDELLKLSFFAFLYLIFFNTINYFFKKFKFIKNTEYLAVIIFYLSFNYSNITIYIYFQAFDFIKFIPNYSFLTFIFLMCMLLLFSTKPIFNKLFEFATYTYLIFIVVISLNSISTGQTETVSDIKDQTFYENIDLKAKPDVYFIIFDGLPSLGTMEKFYDYDTSDFNNLINKNNLVNYSLATSSFGRTTYSMSSLFSLEYVFQDGNISFSNRGDLSKAFRTGDSNFENILRNNDYSLYKFGLAFNCNKDKNDVCITDKIEDYREKNSVYFDLIMRTPIKILIEKGFLKLSPSLSIGCNDGCSDPEFSEILINVSNVDKPKAVFLHFMDTHGPYLLGENCDLLDDPIFDLPKTNIKSYKKSLDCAYLKIETLIKMLDTQNDVIFIQSDHGPNYEKMELTSIEDLSSNQVLNRYSTFSISNLQDLCQEDDVNLTGSVNTFIHFINCFGNPKMDLLDVKNFLAFGKINEDVFDITNVVQETISLNYKK